MRVTLCELRVRTAVLTFANETSLYIRVMFVFVSVSFNCMMLYKGVRVMWAACYVADVNVNYPDVLVN